MRQVEIVAHRAGNTPDAARAALDAADMIELDVHVLWGRVELRHAKVLRPTSRLWEQWYFLPKGSRGVAIEDVLRVLEPDKPLMIDLKCFTRRAARKIRTAIPERHPVTASTRSWWILTAFEDRADTHLLRSCKNNWQLWLAQRLRPGPRRGFSVHERLITARSGAALRARSDLVYSWGATTPARCHELIEAGVTGLILDDCSIVGEIGR